jgi:hypothetical protein
MVRSELLQPTDSLLIEDELTQRREGAKKPRRKKDGWPDLWILGREALDVCRGMGARDGWGIVPNGGAYGKHCVSGRG